MDFVTQIKEGNNEKLKNFLSTNSNKHLIITKDVLNLLDSQIKDNSIFNIKLVSLLEECNYESILNSILDNEYCSNIIIFYPSILNINLINEFVSRSNSNFLIYSLTLSTLMLPNNLSLKLFFNCVEDSVLSMERFMFKELFLDSNYLLLVNEMVKFFKDFDIGGIYCKGSVSSKIGEAIWRSKKNKSENLDKLIDLTRFSESLTFSNKNKRSLSSKVIKIRRMLVVDRTIDLHNCLITKKSLENFLDEVYGINNNEIQISSNRIVHLNNIKTLRNSLDYDDLPDSVKTYTLEKNFQKYLLKNNVTSEKKIVEMLVKKCNINDVLYYYCLLNFYKGNTEYLKREIINTFGVNVLLFYDNVEKLKINEQIDIRDLYKCMKDQDVDKYCFDMLFDNFYDEGFDIVFFVGGVTRTELNYFKDDMVLTTGIINPITFIGELR